MPQVYRRHSDYNPRPPAAPRRRSSIAPPAGPQATDADDSIVLADLVRTGEASRLRRRGAMRLDHGATTTARAPLAGASTAPPNSFIVIPPARPIIIEPSRTPSPEPNPDDGADEYTYSAGPVWRGVEPTPAREPARPERGQTVEILSESIQAGQSFILYCGGDEGEFSDEEEERPPAFQPSPFPLMRSAGSSSRPLGKSIRRSNGCGALVHVRAYPQRPRGVWMAKEEASKTVVGLDAQYCDHSAMDKMLRSACGCIREGIGCSVCGNTLGTRYVPCQAASESFFSPSPSASAAASPPRPIRPFGPSYWNARPVPTRRNTPCSGPSRASPSSYYTFFADRVSSSPPHELASCTSHSHIPETSRRASSRAGSPEVIDYGYRWSASPLPTNAALPSSDSSASSNFVATPLSPVFTLPPLPPLSRTPNQMRPPSAPVRVPRLDIRSSGGPLSTPNGEFGMQVGMDVDPDGVPLGDMEVPGSPDKEGMSWPGR
ncbi:hypothetical protein C2E23DRAFT_725385 [Lenzites betulinus]|nr:hypothetical protein C2E23DRAFT_725385 [Lenzites betulinus]